MKVLQINSVCGIGSTGRIAVAISSELDKRNIENRILYSYGTSNIEKSKKYSNDLYVKSQALLARVLGNYGFNSKWATKRLLTEIASFQPDIVHIHNIHGHDCDLEMLLSYLKRNGIKVVWTFHDCWAFTGYCTYFDMAQCEQWKSGCKNCPQKKKYSWIQDRCSELWLRKKKLLSDIKLTIVTPSQWLADQVKESSLQGFPVEVINNGIDLSVFHPVQSDFRQRYCCHNKFILLGVSFEWGVRKGLDVFLELANRLDEQYQIVLVGTNSEIDRLLPPNVISIHRTQDAEELAKLYTAADLVVNPTREENFPTVNMESLACGTPVLTYRTGGSPEILDEDCGSVVERDDIDALEKEIRSICRERYYSANACMKRAKRFDDRIKFQEYIALYESIEQNAGEK